MLNKLTLTLLLIVAISLSTGSDAEAAGKKPGSGDRPVSSLDLGSSR
ncbi:MAG: hypothetical protein R3D59_06025 [Paracoccaceae bacterium]